MGAIFSISDNTVTIIDWSLINITSAPLKFTLIIDKTGLMFRSTVLFIAANVITFSKLYIKEDQFIDRFSILVILFVLSINILIFIPHFIMLLLGWDGLGITSFILVIYYINPKSLAAGIITALTNRIGDVIILIALALTLNQGHWNIILILRNPYSTIQVIMIMIAGITKRAQIPFSSWLPAAIAAPTPVSALVHSSTLVTAGVFLLIRFYPFLGKLQIFNRTLLFLSVSTLLIAGIRATTECDIKKIIALSTLSQLGIIIIRLGIGLPDVALFHIITHALFKALLFICAGSLIANHSHSQELRWIGNLVSQAPVASSCILIANSALCGLPFIAGFYSKDIIIESILRCSRNMWILILAFIGVGLTAIYTARFSLSTLWSISRYRPIANIKESVNTLIPITLISLIAVISGAGLSWLLLDNISFNIFPYELKLLPIIATLLGGVIGWLLTKSKSTKSSSTLNFNMTSYASCYIWFLVPISSQYILSKFIKPGHSILFLSDHGWLETLGGRGLNKLLINTGSSIEHSSSPSISGQSIMVVISLFVLIYLSIISC